MMSHDQPHTGALQQEAYVSAGLANGMLELLRTDGRIDVLYSTVNPRECHFLYDRVPSTHWVSIAEFSVFLEAIARAWGRAEVVQLARQGSTLGLLPMMREALNGIVRLFGSAPAVVLRRCLPLVSSIARGVSVRYHSSHASSVSMHVEILSAQPLSPIVFDAWMGVTHSIVDLVTRATSIQVVEIHHERGASHGSFRCSW